MNVGVSATIKKHPYAAGGVALGGLFLLFILMRSSGGQSYASNDAQTLQTIAAANAQQSQLAAQVGQANAQLASQNYQTGLAAQVQNNQAIAAQNAAKYQTDAALIAALAGNKTQMAQYDAQVRVSGIEADAYNHQLDTSLLSTRDTNATNLAAYQNTNATNLAALNTQTNAAVSTYKMQADYATTLAQIQGELTRFGIDTQGKTDQLNITSGYDYAKQVNQNQYNINNKITDMVGAAGLNHGTQSLENSLTSILAGVMNQPAIGVAAQNSTQVNNIASASVWQSFWNSVSNLGNTTVKSLFA